jgi:hypothetical protein
MYSYTFSIKAMINFWGTALARGKKNEPFPRKVDGISP